jgi:hypothetical protein
MDPIVADAQQQVRETLIKSGIQFAQRLRDLRAQGKNFPIAMSKSGGLAIIATKATRDQPSVYRFGSPASPLVASVTQATVDRWNAKEPNHPVELFMIQQALMAECSRIFLLLHEIEQGIKREEDRS